MYYVERKGDESLMITGDVLFSNSIGRTEYICVVNYHHNSSWSQIPILENTSSHAVLCESINNLRVFHIHIHNMGNHVEIPNHNGHFDRSWRLYQVGNCFEKCVLDVIICCLFCFKNTR